MSNAAAIEGGVFTAAGRGEDIMPPARQYARCEPVEITSTLISSLAGDRNHVLRDRLCVRT